MAASRSGGYKYRIDPKIDVPYAIVESESPVFYFLKDWVDFTPKEIEIITELEKKTKKELEECLSNNFKALESRLVIIPLPKNRPEVIQPTIKFTEREVILNLQYPLTIRQDDYEEKIHEFLTKLPVRMKKVRDAAEQIVSQITDVCSSIYDQNLLELNKIVRDIDPALELEIERKPDHAILTIKDAELFLDNAPFEFRFLVAVDYEDKPPQFDVIPEQCMHASEGQLYHCKVPVIDQCDENELKYASLIDPYISGVEIDPITGIIEFTPLESEIGEYQITLTVTDGQRNTKQVTFPLSITEINDPPILVDNMLPDSGEMTVYDEEGDPVEVIIIPGHSDLIKTGPVRVGKFLHEFTLDMAKIREDPSLKEFDLILVDGKTGQQNKQLVKTRVS